MVTLLAALALVQQKDVVNDDRDVIQTAMLSFLHHEPWHSADWTPKNYVVLWTQFHGKERIDFQETFDSVKTGLEDNKVNFQEYFQKSDPNDHYLKRAKAEYVQLLNSLKAINDLPDYHKVDSAYTPPPLIPLTKMAWDKRIKVADLQRHSYGDKDPNKYGEAWTVYAWAKRPAYSPDGKVAIVEFMIPWSIHSSDVTFVLQREDDGWTIIANQHRFYL